MKLTDIMKPMGKHSEVLVYMHGNYYALKMKYIIKQYVIEAGIASIMTLNTDMMA